jgi:hypothetical protein
MPTALQQMMPRRNNKSFNNEYVVNDEDEEEEDDRVSLLPQISPIAAMESIRVAG